MSFLKKLNKLNTERQQEWDTEAKVDILFRALEHVAEAGELGNKVKKHWRASNGIVGSVTNKQEIADEVGDVMITLALLCQDLDIDIKQATIDKFNSTSAKYNLKTRWE